MYIYEYTEWPNFTWNSESLISLLAEVRNLQGRIIGEMGALGFELKNEANLEIITQDVVKSSDIEGVSLNHDQVRSSVARRLGLDISGLVESDRNTDGVVEMMVDATENFSTLLTEERLLGWQSSLFPGSFSGINKVLVGKWRDDTNGPMVVISGPMGKETVHYQAPAAEHLPSEMEKLINWINSKQAIDLVLKSALVHLWFVTLHPFEDGNGRIARALTDMVLAQSDGQSYRFYSMSTQIRKERKEYYDILEQTQKGGLDVTEWMKWFLECLLRAVQESEIILDRVIFKHNFWNKNAKKIDNARQTKILNKLLEGFEGKLTTSKWAKIGKCSQDTALRDILGLVDKQILCKLPGGGRSTAYGLSDTEK